VSGPKMQNMVHMLCHIKLPPDKYFKKEISCLPFDLLVNLLEMVLVSFLSDYSTYQSKKSSITTTKFFF
ncbi:hypothetical protein, partial [Bathymodiolus azoricus thioautotrophic gill symbiont]|uniref:hypothetical protein n=1 Tax=Bathymodiolus azoricus thioautotrophic gill symbiont TaxID=235205 RepID=UPI0019D3F19E